jgi:hypothetical protein
MRLMYDSVTASDIPTGSALVAGYVDGRFAWSDADWSRFEGRVKVRIAVLPSTNDGHMLDVETGNTQPDQAPAWVKMRRAAGVDPTVYTNAGLWPDVRAAFKRAGIAEPHYCIALWDGVAELIDGAVAKQYANPKITGGHYDASSVADYWPGVDPPRPSLPRFAGQSAAEISALVGEVAQLTGIYEYAAQGRRFIVAKAVAYAPGVRTVTLYPPADPDADPTLVLDAQPASFIVTTRE